MSRLKVGDDIELKVDGGLLNGLKLEGKVSKVRYRSDWFLYLIAANAFWLGLLVGSWLWS